MTNCNAGHDHSHHHLHQHENGDGHSHLAQNNLKKAIILAIAILGIEIAGGIWANSLALLSDAGHMLTDVASLVVAWIAVKISTNPPSPAMTFGYYRITILAALFNALTLIAIAIFIGGEAYKRFLDPEPVQGAVLFISATVGLVLNLYIGLGMREQADNVNIKSAMLHVLGDAAASAGVIVAGVVMYFTHWYILDPILSILIALLVAIGAWRIIKETYIVLMEGTPPGIKFADVQTEILAVEGIHGVHDLHIWSLTSNRHALSGHVVVNGGLTVAQTQKLVMEIETRLKDEFGIGHVTLQLEDENHPHDVTMLCTFKP